MELAKGLVVADSLCLFLRLVTVFDPESVPLRNWTSSSLNSEIKPLWAAVLVLVKCAKPSELGHNALLFKTDSSPLSPLQSIGSSSPSQYIGFPSLFTGTPSSYRLSGD